MHARAASQYSCHLGLLQEACESGSIFQGLLSDSLNIYATTASNAVESSWGTYCPGMAPSPPPEFNTCLGDLYSVAFLENRCGPLTLLHSLQLHKAACFAKVVQVGNIAHHSAVLFALLDAG